MEANDAVTSTPLNDMPVRAGAHTETGSGSGRGFSYF